MRFSVFTLGQIGPERTEWESLNEDVRLLVWAEDLGFDEIWLAEHHNNHYSTFGSPQTVLAAVAAQTHRVRLGTAICVLPLNHPVKTAEDYAVLDWLSGGRLDFGTGRGATREELAMYEVPFEESRPRMAE